MAKIAGNSIAVENRLIGYARVSTDDQRLNLQMDALREAGVRKENLHIETLSAHSRRRRELELAIKELREGDTFIVWRIDRLARSMRDLYGRLDQIYAAGAGFKSLTEQFDFSTTTGKFILGILGLVAELERQLIADRTAAGIKAWRARGGEPGRKPKLTGKQVSQAQTMLKQERIGAKNRKVPKYTLSEVADRFGVCITTLRNYDLAR